MPGPFYFLKIQEVLNGTIYNKNSDDAIKKTKDLYDFISFMIQNCGQIQGSGGKISLIIFDIDPAHYKEKKTGKLFSSGELNEFAFTFETQPEIADYMEFEGEQIHSPDLFNHIINFLIPYSYPTSYLHITCSKNAESILKEGLKDQEKKILNFTGDVFPFPKFHYELPFSFEDLLMTVKSYFKAAPPGLGGKRKRKQKRKQTSLRKKKSKKERKTKSKKERKTKINKQKRKTIKKKKN